MIMRVAGGGTLAAFALVCVSSAAMADGMEAAGSDLCFDKGVNEAMPCEAPAFVGPWTGLYAGVHAGYGRAAWDGSIEAPGVEVDPHDDHDVIDLVDHPLLRLFGADWDEYSIELSDLSAGGFVIGGHLGYLHQTKNNWVFGVEGDISVVAGMEGDVNDDRVLMGDDGARILFVDGLVDDARVDATAAFDAEVDWLASLRLRAGRAYGDLMPFVTAGVGFAKYEVSGAAGVTFLETDFTSCTPDCNFETASVSQASGSDDGLAVGPVIGGGLEYMITPGMTVRGEALYYIFNEEIDVSGLGEDGGDALDAGGSLELDNVLVGRVAFSVQF